MGSIQQALLAVPATGGGGFTPSDIANIWDWWEPSREGGYANSDPVPTLTGQFAAKTWFQASSSHYATYLTNAINGLAVTSHSAGASSSQGWDEGPDMSGLTAGHVFIVVKIGTDPPASAGDTGLWSMSNNLGESFPSTHFPWTDGSIYDACGSTTRKTVGNPTPSLASFRVYEVISTSSEWTALLDGTQLFTTGTNTVGFLGTSPKPRLGLNYNDVDRAGLIGQIAGMYIFSAKISGADRTAMIDYVNDRFALSSS